MYLGMNDNLSSSPDILKEKNRGTTALSMMNRHAYHRLQNP